MSNSRELPDVRERQKFPKNNFFNYRWRVLDNFSKQIDKHLFNLQAKISGTNNTVLSERIIQGYQASLSGSDSSTKNNDLIGDLAQDAMQFVAQRNNENRVSAKSEVVISKATTSLINRTFKTLLALSTELNSVLGFSDLSVRATEPEVTKRAGKSESSHATCVQASIFTGLFRLLIEGKDSALSFYMIPTANLSAMIDASSIYKPFTVWRANFAEGDQVYWITPDGILTEEMLDRACAELIRWLIETTQEELAPGSTNNASHAERAGSVSVSEFSQADPWMQQQAPVQSTSSEWTQTDSVPSLGTLYKESGIFDAVDYDYSTPSVQNFFEQKNEPKPAFDVRTEFDADAVAEQKLAKAEALAEEKPAYEFKPAFQMKQSYEQKVFDQPVTPELKAEFKPELNPGFKPEIKPQDSPSMLLSAQRAPLVPPLISPPAAVVPTPEPAFQAFSAESPNLDVNFDLGALQPGAIIGTGSKSLSEIEKTKSFDLKAEYYAHTAKPAKAASTNKRASRNKSNTRKNRKNKKK